MSNNTTQKKGAAYWIGFLLASLIVGAAFLFVITVIIALAAAIAALL